MAASRVLAISVNKCDHVSERKLISTFSYDLRMQDVYELYHPPLADCSKQYVCSAHSAIGDITMEVKVGEIVDSFNVKAVDFRCTPIPGAVLSVPVASGSGAVGTKRPAIDTFAIMMGRRRAFPVKKLSR